MMFVFEGFEEVTKPADSIGEVEEVELLRLFRLMLCWLWANVNYPGSHGVQEG